MAKGTYTALQKLRPIDIDWGDVAKSGNEREDFLKAKELEAKKYAKEQRDKLDYDVQEAVITGIDSLDQGLTLGIQEASSMQHADYKKALDDPKFADSAEYKIRTKNLNNYSKNVKAMSDGIANLSQQVIAKSQDGTLSEWDNELMQTLNGAYVTEAVKFGTNPDGSVKALMALTDQSLITDDNPKGYVKDENGRIKMKQVTPSEIFKGLGGFSITPDVDVEKDAIDFGKELGEDIKTEVTGYETVEEQKWENKEPEVREAIKGKFGTAKSPTPMAKRIWADLMGKDSRTLTDANMTEIEDYYLNIVKTTYDEKYKESVAFGARESARGRHQKRTEAQVSPEYVLDTDTGAPQTIEIDGVETNIISFGSGKGIQVKKTEAERESYKNVYVDASGKVYADKFIETKGTGSEVIYEKDAQGRNTDVVDLAATALMKQTKGWETETKEKQRLSETDVTNLVKNPNMVKEDGSRFKDNKDFKDYMKAKKSKLPKGQSSGSAGDDIFKTN